MSASAPDRFRSPDRRFRPAAFWFWHHLPDEREIAARLGEIASSGIGTILIQARLALPRADYLSPAYLELCRLASHEADRLGLGVEIYDEYNWMSGHGGGRTVEGADHLRERHLFWSSATVRGGRAEARISELGSSWLDFLGEDGAHWCYENGAPRFEDWTLVAVHARLSGGEAVDLASRARIERCGSRGCRIDLGDDLPEDARITAFASARCASSRLVNYLLPEAAERFAARVYEPLVKAADGTARGLFFDHPYAGFYRWAEHEGNVGNSLLWEPDLPAHLPPEPLHLQLAALVGDAGPETAGLRARFFEAYGARMHEAFFGTLRRWCDERSLAFTGHELLTHVGGWALHDGLNGMDPRSMPGVDYFGLDRYRSETAVDAADFRPQLAAKLGDSVARANGRSRCTLEQYATGREVGLPGLSGQWGLTLESLRAQSVRHTLFGARRILLHALCLTDGFPPDERPGPNPRFDFPPGYNFQPWWEDVRGTLDELSRLSAFLDDGRPLRPVALLYPLETIRAEGTVGACGRHFGWWSEALSQAGIGFDVVDEASFSQGSVAAGELVLASGRYETLILPAAAMLASAANAELIARFAAAGGRLLASGPLPFQSRERGAGPSVARAIGEAMRRPASHHAVEADRTAIDAIVAAISQPVLRFETGASWVAAAQDGAGLRVATFNDACERRAAVLDFGPASVALRRWYPDTGEISELGTLPGRPVRIEIAAGTILCLEMVPCDPAPVVPSAPCPEAPPPVPLAGDWLFSTREGGEAFRPIETGRGWERQDFERFAGTGLYRRVIDLPPLAPDLAWHLVLPDVAGTATCWVDGKQAGCRVAGEAAFALPTGRGRVLVELQIRNTAANRYDPGPPLGAGVPQPSGLVGVPRLEARPPGAPDIRILS